MAGKRAVGRLLFVMIITSLVCARLALADDGELVGPIGVGSDPKDGRIYFINGVRTSREKAVTQAQALSGKFGYQVWLVYNDLRMKGVRAIDQGAAIGIEKLVGADYSVNEATTTLRHAILADREAGRTVRIVGFSAGALITHNAVRGVADDWGDVPAERRRQLLAGIHVIYVGGGVFRESHLLCDSLPEGVSRFDLFDLADGVAGYVGAGRWADSEARAHAFVDNYVPHVEMRQFTISGERRLERGRVMVDAVVSAPNPADRVVRIRVQDLRADQESRRSVENLPLNWGDSPLQWRIVGHPDAAAIDFAAMRDLTMAPDEAVQDGLQSGADSGPISGEDLYIGRVRYRDKKDEARLWRRAVHEGFFIEVRPVNP